MNICYVYIYILYNVVIFINEEGCINIFSFLNDRGIVCILRHIFVHLFLYCMKIRTKDARLTRPRELSISHILIIVAAIFKAVCF